MYSKVDPGELTRAGYQRLAALAQAASDAPGEPAPERLPEREQRRTTTRLDPPPPRN